MFFQSKTIEALTHDHKSIKNEASILADASIPYRDRRDTFEILVPSLVSHSRREERVIYRYMKEAKDDFLKSKALEGLEFHLLVNRLVQEMKNGRLSIEEWSAKAKVLGDLISLHLANEESEVFPKLKRLLDDSSDLKLFAEYEKPYLGDLTGNPVPPSANQPNYSPNYDDQRFLF